MTPRDCNHNNAVFGISMSFY